MELVKRGKASDVGFRHNGTLNMGKTLDRPDFVTLMGEKVNDMRFT